MDKLKLNYGIIIGLVLIAVSIGPVIFTHFIVFFAFGTLGLGIALVLSGLVFEWIKIIDRKQRNDEEN